MRKDESPRLRLENVQLSVPDETGERVLASSLNLEIAPNQLVAVNGASGSGKSTLLRAITRMHPCTTGTIHFDGKSIFDYQPPVLRQRIAYLRQFPVFSPGTLAESLYEPFAWKALPTEAPSMDELTEILETVGLKPSLLKQETNKLSGGEAQRAALARAFVLHPDVLLLDESTANLDPDHEEAFVDKVETWLNKNNHAAIWVTHSRELLKRLHATHLQLTPDGFKPGENHA